MTELYIYGQKCVPPQSMSLTLIEENPFYTKSGPYTLDLELSLEEPTNAKIYEHQNRSNKVENIERKRPVVLIVDNEVVLNGTEKILGWSDTSVTIRLMSGNAELNFLIGGHKQLRDLDLGSATPFVAPIEQGVSPWYSLGKVVFESWKHSYPSRDWHLLPYYTGEPALVYPHDDGIIRYPCGNYLVFQIYNPDSLPTSDPRSRIAEAMFDGHSSGQVPQPYLCFIIKKVLSSLGYKLTYNAIESDPVLKNAYIVHGFQTMEFAKMLPGWTINEFFSKIELQFDCTLLIDQETKSARLLFNYQKYANNEVTTLEVIDEYETEVDDENILDVRSANIAYSLDGDDYYKYMDINPLFRKMAKTEYYSGLNALLALIQSDDIDRFKKIYIDKDTNDQFIAYDTGKIVDGKQHIIPKRVDSFRPLYNRSESEEIDLQFDIIPASMVIERLNTVYPDTDWTWSQMATAGGFDQLSKTTVEKEDPWENFNLQTMIEDDTSLENESSYSKMRLAIYSGLSELDNSTRTRYPISYVEPLCEYFEETGIERYFGTKGSNPFRLAYFNTNIYSKSRNIDTTLIYNRVFLNHEKINLTSKFIIKNKSFVCRKIERTITIDGFDSVAEGEFYPINE